MDTVRFAISVIAGLLFVVLNAFVQFAPETLNGYLDPNVSFTLFFLLAGTYITSFTFALAENADPNRGFLLRLVMTWYLLLPVLGTFVILMNAIKPIGSAMPSTYFSNVPTGNDWHYVSEVFLFWLDQFLATICFDFFDIFDVRMSTIRTGEGYEGKTIIFVLRLYFTYVAIYAVRLIWLELRRSRKPVGAKT